MQNKDDRDRFNYSLNNLSVETKGDGRIHRFIVIDSIKKFFSQTILCNN